MVAAGYPGPTGTRKGHHMRTIGMRADRPPANVGPGHRTGTPRGMRDRWPPTKRQAKGQGSVLLHESARRLTARES